MQRTTFFELAVYSSCRRRINSAEVSELLTSLQNGKYKICEGLRQNDYLNSIAKDPVDQSHSSFSVHSFLFDKDVSKEQVICKTCQKLQKQINQQQTRKERKSCAPAKDKASLAACSAEKLRATVEADRLRCKELEKRIENLQSKIEKHAVNVSEPLEKDLLSIMSVQNLDSTPHMKFFWEQQMRLLQTNKMGRKYNPQVIRFALSIHCKSPSAYRELRESGALILPSERVLRDYKKLF